MSKITVYSHEAQSGKVFRKLIMTEVFAALGMPEQAAAGCVLTKDGKSLLLWEPKAAKQDKAPHIAKEMQAAITAWVEHIKSGAGKLEDIQDKVLRDSVARLMKPAPIQMPPVKQVIQMPPARQVNESGPVGSTITRRKKVA